MWEEVEEKMEKRREGGENDKANGDRDRMKGGNFINNCSFGVICNDK